eukprot:COSAG06_NODE_49880_length_322_cov_1.139013_1_plen_44_part_01
MLGHLTPRSELIAAWSPRGEDEAEDEAEGAEEVEAEEADEEERM